jgi:hypothetical protein
MPSDHGLTRRWLIDIQYHIGMAQGFVAGKARHASIEWRDMAAAGNIYRRHRAGTSKARPSQPGASLRIRRGSSDEQSR